MSYRVIYGETMPVWERIFPDLKAARGFAKKCDSIGDKVFSIAKVVEGQGPLAMVPELLPQAKK